MSKRGILEPYEPTYAEKVTDLHCKLIDCHGPAKADLYLECIRHACFRHPEISDMLVDNLIIESIRTTDLNHKEIKLIVQMNANVSNTSKHKQPVFGIEIDVNQNHEATNSRITIVTGIPQRSLSLEETNDLRTIWVEGIHQYIKISCRKNNISWPSIYLPSNPDSVDIRIYESRILGKESDEKIAEAFVEATRSVLESAGVDSQKLLAVILSGKSIFNEFTLPSEDAFCFSLATLFPNLALDNNS